MFYKVPFLILLLNSFVFSQKNDEKFIKSVEIKSGVSKFSNTIHSLKNKISFNFDDINGNQDEYYYLITHCEIDWTPSNLPTSYYIDGFNNFQINHFENSFGTLQNYTHYQFNIPNEDTIITKSGNYLFQILDEDENIVCERRITLYENKASVALKISESRDLINLNKKQAVALTINAQNIAINYPRDEIKTFIFQNGDRQIRTPYLQPTFTNNKLYTYRPTKETEFYAGNEFYYFDNNEILANSRFIVRNYREDHFFNTILFPKRKRNKDIYVYNPDINGNFLFRVHNSQNTATEAEYSKIHFALMNDPQFKNLEIYVYGAFNNYQFTEENKLHLDTSGKYLTANIFLKQGFYNYDFVTKKNNTINKEIISGSFFETENNYESLVYFQPMNSIYYEVIGYGIGNSKQQIEN